MTRRSLIMSAVAMALRKEKVDEAVALIQRQVESGSVHAASLHVFQGKQVVDRAFGAAKTAGCGFPSGVDLKTDDGVGGDAALRPQAALARRSGEQVHSGIPRWREGSYTCSAIC